MTVDKDKLRQAAEAAKTNPGETADQYHFDYLANPATVLALLDELAACKAGAEMMVARVQEESTSWRLTCKVYEKANRALDEQLAAMTKARDEACNWLMESVAPSIDTERRISALRKVGTHD